MGHPKSSVKYGTGQYDKSAHGGTGTSQKLLSPTAGEHHDRATPHAGSAPVRDGAQGHGNIKRGYQHDAHSSAHHGKSGEAVGVKNDLHMDYNKELYSEGRELVGEDRGATRVPAYDHGTQNKAAHHPRMSSTPHKFERMATKDAHGYGHQPSHRDGHLRMSGHSHGHQVGKK